MSIKTSDMGTGRQGQVEIIHSTNVTERGKLCKGLDMALGGDMGAVRTGEDRRRPALGRRGQGSLGRDAASALDDGGTCLCRGRRGDM